MKKNTLKLILGSAVLTLSLSACQSSNTPLTTTQASITQSTSGSITITGLAYEQAPLANAQVSLLDATGKEYKTETNSQGIYSLQISDLHFPLLVSVVARGKTEDCSTNSQLRPICLAGLINKPSTSNNLIANINPLSDRIVSDLAVTKGFIGPQQWVNSKIIGAVDSAQLQTPLDEQRKSFKQAFSLAKIKSVNSFDPATYPMQPNDSLTALLSLVHHNRNYDNNTGETGHTTLSDISFRPLVGLLANGEYETFDLARAQREWQQIQNAKRRIFIVGDSTSAVYEQLRYPRMGWGQAFSEQLKVDSNVQVIVGSRAGRSSRDFYNGRWFAQMEPMIQTGDYVFINHGHNDQNCDSSKPVRGLADVKNLCTYPNNTKGQPQFPDDNKTLSFQHSLERYIEIARENGAIPVLFTPTTRIKNAQGQQSTPVVHSHLTKQNANKGYMFTGDYTQTIKDAATANAVPLIDLEAASIGFANQLPADGWKNYWLVVDPSVNSFYANGVAGSPQTPDGTHFQKNGAEVMAGLVAREIKANTELVELQSFLRE